MDISVGAMPYPCDPREHLCMRTFLTCLGLAAFPVFGVAQTMGTPRYIPLQQALHKVEYGEMLERPAMLCTGERSYAFECAREGLNPIYRYFGYAYDLEAGTVLAARNLGLPEEKNARPIEGFFLAGDRPAYLQRHWDGKTGVVTLDVQVLDPATLLPEGTPVRIGTATLDRDSYKGYSMLGVDVHHSPDRSRTVFCFDQVQDKGMQVVMCWVTSATLEPVWQGIYKISVQATGYQRELLLGDDGAVLLEANAVQLDASDVKASGRVKEQSESKRSRAWFRFRGEEQRMWDGVLPDGRTLDDAGMVLLSDRPWLGGFVERDGAWEWVRFSLDDEFKPARFRSGDHP